MSPTAPDGAPLISLDHESLRDLLSVLGARDEDIARWEQERTLGLALIAHLALSGEAKYDQGEVAERAGLPLDITKRMWRSMGFPDVAEGERVFTEDDIDALRVAAELLRHGVLDPDVAVQVARVMAQSVARIADVQIGIIEDRTRNLDAVDELHAEALFNTPKLLEYQWRRQLQAAARRMVMREASAAGSDAVAVGFADLVGFTALSQQISAVELAEVVDRFVSLANDTVARLGGRLVKTIGDEAMFIVDDAAKGVEIALSLAETYADDESLSDVRVGVACGPVLPREGDYYGPVVNLASRIVGLALPGSVVVSEDVHDKLVDDPTLRWRSLRPRNLKGIGRVRLWRVRRSPA